VEKIAELVMVRRNTFSSSTGVNTAEQPLCAKKLRQQEMCISRSLRRRERDRSCGASHPNEPAAAIVRAFGEVIEPQLVKPLHQARQTRRGGAKRFARRLSRPTMRFVR